MREPLPPGVHVAMSTPFTEELEIDVDAVRRLVNRMIEGGINGLNIMGSTGENASLSGPKRRNLVEAAIDAAAGRVPAIAAMVQDSFDDAVREVDALAGQGVTGVLVTPPHYYPITQPAVEDYYRALAPRSRVPLLIYNIPQFTKVSVAPRVVGRLARDGVIAGIKDSSRDFEYFSQVVYGTRGIDGFRVFTGSDTMLLASLAVGGDGTIAGGPNLDARLPVELYQAFRGGDIARASALQEKILRLVLASRAGVAPAGIKAGLEMQGVCRGIMAPPVPRLADGERQQLELVMRELRILGGTR